MTLGAVHTVAAAGVAGGALTGLIFLTRHHDQRRRDGDRITYRLDFPPHLTTDAVTAFSRSLICLRSRPGLLGRDSVVFEVVSQARYLEHRLRLPRRQDHQLPTHLVAAVPASRLAQI
ncbi:hypothetical protein [Kibdelosporangium persicum]|uniref:hypothetical protein n=1 Tax=Kibdelosporangium persicum TaxID=2698649 RepID=UPI0015663668|nr:hypothetical protein [Kibdelosporangium persicum]